MKTIILTDSCCDITLSFAEENSDVLDVVGMPVNLDGIEYFDDFGKSLSHNELYDRLRQGSMPSTAQINVFRFYEKFREHYEKGNSVLYIGFSSNMSGTFYNAHVAKNELIEQHPDADIKVVDSLSASIGQGVLIVKSVEMLRQGKTKEEIAEWIEQNKMKVNHWFAVDDLNYLKKGGRISATTAAVGSALNIKPIVTVDMKGKLVSYTNVRGRKKSIKYLADMFSRQIGDTVSKTVIIGHGNCEEDALLLKDYITSESSAADIIISELSATIASHVGPNMIAIAFVGDNREPK